MEKTNRPTVAGILTIISGVFGLIGTISLFIGFGVTSRAFGIPIGYIPAFVPGLILFMAILSALIDILALLGGIYAIQQKMWGLSLAGAIAAIMVFLPLGIPAVILIAQAKNEFE